MKLSRLIKPALLGTAILAATALGYGIYLLANLAPIGTAYAAKMLCSGVFVSGRPAENVIGEDIRAENHPLLGFIEPTINAGRHVASATLFDLAHREARYRPGLGCTIALEPVREITTAAPDPSE